LGHKSLEFELLGHCIFCFVLFTDCKSLSFQTSLWHDNDSEEVGASFHASSLEQNKAKREVESGRGADESGGGCGGLLGRETNEKQDRTLENDFDKVILN
jgi:hypothetical protein